MKSVKVLTGFFLLLLVQGLFSLPAFAGEVTHKQINSKHYHSQDKIRVMVKDDYGHKFPMFRHRYRDYANTNKYFLQARPEQSYSIEVKNLTDRRIAVVIAVDGRNIINGRRSNLSSHEKKYVLGPYQKSTYRGWRSGRHHINRFYFTEEDYSYSASFGDYSAMGIIAVAAFHEAVEEYPHEISRYHKNKSGKHGQIRKHSHKADPGTGWGEEEVSTSRRVRFVAMERPFNTKLIKYEWRKDLCKRGVVHCRRENRLWDESLSYAPAPNWKYRW